KIAVDKAMSSPQIEVRFNTQVVEFKGANNRLTTVVVNNSQSRATEEMHPAAVFVFIGLTPNSQPAKDIARTDSQGFVMTGIDFQTSTEGIFSAGDVRLG